MMDIRLNDLKIKQSYSLGSLKIGVQQFQGKFEQIEVKSSTTEQIVLPSAGKNGINKVIVKPIVLQNKIVSPTHSKQVVEADNGFDGLKEVQVDEIPSNLIDTSDATATESDIVNGKTAYSNGTKLVGTLELGGKLPKVIERTATELSAEDLAGAMKIGLNAFYYYSTLKRVDLPDSVTSIESQSFMGCTNLASVSNLKNVVDIGTWAFSDCQNLSVHLELTNIKTIGMYAFGQCYALPSITIGNKITSIGSSAFSNCRNLTTMTVLAVKPPVLNGTITSYVQNIYVPDESVEAYKSATNWSSSASAIKPLSEKP